MLARLPSNHFQEKQDAFATYRDFDRYMSIAAELVAVLAQTRGDGSYVMWGMQNGDVRDYIVDRIVRQTLRDVGRRIPREEASLLAQLAMSGGSSPVRNDVE